MAFVKRKATSYRWPVKIEVPLDGGSFEVQRMTVEFKRISQSQIEKFKDIPDHLLALGTTDLVRHCKKIQKLPDLHAVVHAEVIRHVTDASAHIHRALIHTETIDGPIAARCLEKRCKKANGGAFAGAVGPDEPE